ncbi:OprD family outer membrane porin [Thiomicrolovo sp. ZZH C-3]
MRKGVLQILAGCSLALGAAEMTEEMMTEEGWFHGRQAGWEDDMNRSAPSLQGVELFGTLRGMWIDAHRDSVQKTATAVGGRFGVQTAEFYGVSAMAALQTSQRFWGINPTGAATLHPELYGSDGEPFTYLSEAQLQYRVGDLLLRGGRIKVETPFADPDDIRMACNTFEGVSAGYALNDRLSVDLLYLVRWAGFDSGEAQSDFVRLAEESEGLLAAGMLYTPADEAEVSLWAYHVDRQYDLLYAEAVGRLHFRPLLHLEWGLQGAQMHALADSGIGGSVLGAMGILHYRNLYGGLAYNRAVVSGEDVVTDGFGGGPYFTSLDEATVAAASEIFPGHSLSVYRVGGGIGLGDAGAGEGLHLEAVYGLYDPDASPASIAETDLLLWTEAIPRLRVDMVFSDFDGRRCDHPGCFDFERYWIRLDYSF